MTRKLRRQAPDPVPPKKPEPAIVYAQVRCPGCGYEDRETRFFHAAAGVLYCPRCGAEAKEIG